MSLLDAIQPHGTAHNRTSGLHIEVWRSTVVNEYGQPQGGFTVTLHTPADIRPQQSVHIDTDIGRIEQWIHETYPQLDMNAWTDQ